MSQKIYIAGKVTGLDTSICKANFGKPTEYLRSKGFEVINPVELIEDPKTEWNTAMKKCIAELVHCDAVLLLDNWKESEGATFENHIAQRLDIKVFTSPWSINEYFRNR